MSIWSRGLTGINNRTQRNPRTPIQTPQPPAKATPPAPEKAAEEIPPDHLSVYNTSEAWPRKFKDATPGRKEKVSPHPPGRPRMKPQQRRRNTISIAMSEEEEEAIRRAAAEKGVSISEWARVAMFKHMGRQVPKRDVRRRDWSALTGEDDE